MFKIIKKYIADEKDKKAYAESLIDPLVVWKNFVSCYIDGENPKGLPKAIKYRLLREIDPNSIYSSGKVPFPDTPVVYLDYIRRLHVAETLYVNGWIKPLLLKKGELCHIDEYGDFRAEDFSEELLRFVKRRSNNLIVNESIFSEYPDFFVDLANEIAKSEYAGDVARTGFLHVDPEDEFDDSIVNQIISDIEEIIDEFECFYDEPGIDLQLSEDEQEYALRAMAFFQHFGWSCKQDYSANCDFQTEGKLGLFNVVCRFQEKDIVSTSVVNGLYNADEKTICITNVDVSDAVKKRCDESINLTLLAYSDVWRYVAENGLTMEFGESYQQGNIEICLVLQQMLEEKGWVTEYDYDVEISSPSDFIFAVTPDERIIYLVGAGWDEPFNLQCLRVHYATFAGGESRANGDMACMVVCSLSDFTDEAKNFATERGIILCLPSNFAEVIDAIEK